MAGVGVLGFLIGGAALALVQGGTGDPDRARIEQIVREYILANPEIIPEAIDKLQQRQMAEVIEQNRAALEKPWHGAWKGAADADVVLVEFFDYACSFCRSSLADIDRLIAEDKKLKVVLRELPVLGDESVAAALTSLAVARAGQQPFHTFHEAVYAAGPPSSDTVAAAKRKAGVQSVQESADLQDEIDKNYRLASSLRANGTPLFVVGNQVFQGAVGYDTLKQAIAEARKEK